MYMYIYITKKTFITFDSKYFQNQRYSDILRNKCLFSYSYLDIYSKRFFILFSLIPLKWYDQAQRSFSNTIHKNIFCKI